MRQGSNLCGNLVGQLVFFGVYATYTKCLDINDNLVFSVASEVSDFLGVGKFTACMALVGHTSTHLRHKRHLL
jgi:hypothetical protein